MDPWQKAHFMRRATFGATLAELNDAATPADLLSTWLGAAVNIEVPVLGPIAPANDPLRGQQIAAFNRWLLQQMVTAANPLHERIVDFWRNYFTVSIRQVATGQYLTDYETRLRTYALGDFQELLWQVTISPAMLNYLNNGQSRVNNINENFSREVMELFSLGQGNYTETDIQEGARALTGWQIFTDREAGTYTSRFVASRHDAKEKTFLGQTGKFKPQDVISILANQHPTIGRYLAYRLWSYFVYPNPEADIIDRIATVYAESNRNIAAVLNAIFMSPEFYSDRAYRCRMKSPIEFMTGTLRQLAIRANYDRVIQGLRSLGQMVYTAPTVRGWAENWLTAPSLISRLNLSQQMTKEYVDDSGFGYDPARYSTDDLFSLLLDGPDDTVMNSLAGLSARDTAALLLSSPAYQFV
jgi:uncharacterized protein (DUF1800 family)